jgi:hypothetical protein
MCIRYSHRFCYHAKHRQRFIVQATPPEHWSRWLVPFAKGDIIMIYKISYVVQGGQFPGAIKNQAEMPKAGDIVTIGPRKFEIIEVYEMMPPRDDFQFLHATVKVTTSTSETTT